MVASASARAKLDLGKLLMIPAAAGLLMFDLDSLAQARGHSGHAGALWWLGTGLTCLFYTLIIWCYLRRGPAIATSRSVTAHIAALTATWLPFVFPLLRSGAAGPARQSAADLLLVVGTGWALWSLRFLGRNLSVLAQAREVVDRGPYRWVRHPLYTGEIMSALGLAVAAGSYPAAAVWLGLCGLQGYRAVREEQLLLRALPGYQCYRVTTAALLPRVF